MATTKTKRKGPRPKTKSGKPRARKGVKIKPTELGATELGIGGGEINVDALPENARALVAQVAADGGAVLAAYKEPLGGHVQLFAALPIDLVEPTPYQRDVSDSHVRRLTLAMDRTRRYLDPVIAVRGDDKYLTPNGNHRLTAMKELGAKTILTLLIPEPEVAFQILALNIEKAHNLREKSLEVFRMYGELAKVRPDAREEECALEFEEPQLCTLGFAYSERGRLSGGAYQPFLKKVDFFSEGHAGRRHRRARAAGHGAARVRRGGRRGRGEAQGARADQPVPEGVRGGAGQSAALHEGRGAAVRRAPGDDDEAGARDEGGQHQAARPGAIGRRARRRGIARLAAAAVAAAVDATVDDRRLIAVRRRRLVAAAHVTRATIAGAARAHLAARARHDQPRAHAHRAARAVAVLAAARLTVPVDVRGIAEELAGAALPRRIAGAADRQPLLVDVRVAAAAAPSATTSSRSAPLTATSAARTARGTPARRRAARPTSPRC